MSSDAESSLNFYFYFSSERRYIFAFSTNMPIESAFAAILCSVFNCSGSLKLSISSLNSAGISPSSSRSSKINSFFASRLPSRIPSCFPSSQPLQTLKIGQAQAKHQRCSFLWCLKKSYDSHHQVPHFYPLCIHF